MNFGSLPTIYISNAEMWNRPESQETETKGATSAYLRRCDYPSARASSSHGAIRGALALLFCITDVDNSIFLSRLNMYPYRMLFL